MPVTVYPNMRQTDIVSKRELSNHPYLSKIHQHFAEIWPKMECHLMFVWKQEVIFCFGSYLSQKLMDFASIWVKSCWAAISEYIRNPENWTNMACPNMPKTQIRWTLYSWDTGTHDRPTVSYMYPHSHCAALTVQSLQWVCWWWCGGGGILSKSMTLLGHQYWKVSFQSDRCPFGKRKTFIQKKPMYTSYDTGNSNTIRWHTI